MKSATVLAAFLAIAASSSAQSVADLCPCEPEEPAEPWDNHGEYVSCVVNATKTLDLSKRDARTEKRTAAKSECGKAKECESITTKKQCNNKWGGACLWDDDEDVCEENPEPGNGGGQEKERDCGSITRQTKCPKKWGGACMIDNGLCVPNTSGGGPGGDQGGGQGNEKMCKSITRENKCPKKWGGVCQWNSDINECEDNPNPGKPGNGGEGGGEGGGEEKDCESIENENQCNNIGGGRCMWKEDDTCDDNPDYQGPGNGGGESEESEESDESEDDGEEKACSDIDKENQCNNIGGGRCMWACAECVNFDSPDSEGCGR